jgi:hypothetical protein
MSGDETAIADLVIRGGTVISTDAELPASVAIKDGTVLAVGAEREQRRHSRQSMRLRPTRRTWNSGFTPFSARTQSRMFRRWSRAA